MPTGRSDDRLAAIRLLGLGDAKTARRVFPALLDARQPTAVQLAVLQAMAGFLDRSAAGEILVRWKAMSPSVRREASRCSSADCEGIEALLGAIESRLACAVRDRPGSIAPVARRTQTLAFRSRAQKIVDSGAVPSRDRAQVVAAYRPALEMAGDRERGREVFAKTCATCHQAEGRGIDVGPNLATVTNRSGGRTSRPHPRPEPRGGAELRELQRGHRGGTRHLGDHRRRVGQRDRRQTIGGSNRRDSPRDRSRRLHRPGFP